MLPADRRGTGVKTLAFIGALALTLVVAGPATAKVKRYKLGDFQYAKEGSSIPAAGPLDTTVGEVSPKCGKGWSLAGGGALPKGLPGHTRMTQTGIGGNRDWFAQAVHLDSEKTKLIGYSACVHDRDVDVNTSVQNIGPGPAVGNHSVACTSDLSAMGGGVELTGDPTVWALNSTLPQDTGADLDSFPDDQWRDYMFYGGAGTQSFLVELICGEDLPTYKTEEASLDDGFDVATATATCAGKQHVTGGGVFITGDVDEALVVASYPVDGKDKDKAPDDGWRGRGSNDGNPKTLTTYAICLPQPA